MPAGTHLCTIRRIGCVVVRMTAFIVAYCLLALIALLLLAAWVMGRGASASSKWDRE